ncbi:MULTISPECIES: urease accessory protein UreF [Brachybacterium]|uniref:urease accessory protein UreF n=1 Tax=Brachybacterium TaxID=43668 RepID=UPI00026C68D3|nr:MULTISPECIES: urease accessory UreF family protein [Brachybacterium]MDV3294205.1 urease accessory protein UreF [Brachybacterium paraconglomeratum]TDP79231.1 urease accessory protein [Brachybacterium sp. AG952]
MSILASTTIAMLLADSRLPAGAHVSSGALEAALRHGLDPAATGDYLSGRMATIVPVEAGTAVVARHLARHGGDLDRLHREWAARTPSRAQREVTLALGDGLRRLADQLWPSSIPAPPPGAARRPRPIVLGLIAAAAGLDAEDLVRLVAYDDAQTVAAALLKLEPGDPREATALVIAACARLEPRVAELAALTDPARIPCAGAPLIDGWAEAQSQLPRRLFRA